MPSYQKLADSEQGFEDSSSVIRENRRSCQIPWQWITAIIGFVAGVALMIIIDSVQIETGGQTEAPELPILGRAIPMPREFSRKKSADRRPTAPPGPLPSVFVANDTFASKPNQESDEAWREILPSM